MTLGEFLDRFVVADDIVSIRTFYFKEAFGFIGYAYSFLHDVDDPNGYLDKPVMEVFVGQDELLTIRIDDRGEMKNVQD